MVEELARVYGYQHLPTTSLPPIEGQRGQVLTLAQRRVRTSRRVLAARGFLETVTWSFVSEAQARAFGGTAPALRIDNPVSSDLDFMRPSALPHLIAAAGRNVAFGEEASRLFEAGPVYRSDAPDGQARMITGLVKARQVRHWQGNATGYDVYTAKADVMAVLAALGQPVDRLMVMKADGDYWHPGRSASLRLGPKNTLAVFGEIHPAILKDMGVDGPVFAFEITLDAIPEPKSDGLKAKPVLPERGLSPIRRDFAFVVSEDTAAGDVLKAASGAEKALITDARVFDVYRGAGLGEGMKSVAIEVTVQPRGQAMTDADIETLSSRVVASVKKATGGELRG